MVAIAFCGASGQTVKSPVGLLDFRLAAYNGEAGAMKGSFHPALLAKQEHWSIAVASEQRFGTGGIPVGRLALALPAGNGCFGAHAEIMQTGFYHTGAAGIGYARTFGNSISAGIRLGSQWEKAPAKNHRSIIAEVGVLLQLGASLHAGVLAGYAAGGGRSGLDPLHMPYYLRVGTGYNASGKLAICLEVALHALHVPSVGAGIQYKPANHLSCSTGFASGGNLFYITVAHTRKSFTVMLSFTQHLQLGVTPAIILGYHGKENM